MTFKERLNDFFEHHVGTSVQTANLDVDNDIMLSSMWTWLRREYLQGTPKDEVLEIVGQAFDSYFLKLPPLNRVPFIASFVREGLLHRLSQLYDKE